MKLTAKDVSAYVNDPAKNSQAALIYGPDNGLVAERAKQVMLKMGVDRNDPFAFLELNEAEIISDPARLADELAAISMLSARRFILIRGASDKLTKPVEAALPYLNEAVFLLVTTDELSARSSLRLLFEKEKTLAALACYNDSAIDMQQVIRQKLDGIRYGRDVSDYLVSQLGNDRQVTLQELDKILLWLGDEKNLTLEDARMLTGINRDTTLDDACNALADRNLVALDAVLMQMEREAVAPIVWLRAMQRYMQRLYALSEQLAAGKSADEIVSAIRPPVFYKQAPLLVRHLRGWSHQASARLLAQLAAAELACKSNASAIPAITARQMLMMALKK